MNTVWTEPSRQDLRGIFEFIAEDNPKAACTLLDEIKARVGVLIDQQRPVSKINLHDLENSQIDWAHYQSKAEPVLKLQKNYSNIKSKR